MRKPFDVYKLPYRIFLEKDPYEQEEKEVPYKIERIKGRKRVEVEKIVEKERKKVLTLPSGLLKEEESFSLEDIGSKIVGNIFDRVKFLRQRILELEEAIEARKEMNKKFNEEIEREIAELERILPTISDKEELREFKLNLMMLRMEKRKENTNFWKDIVALKKQLRGLLEEYEIESKLSRILGGGNGRIQHI